MNRSFIKDLEQFAYSVDIVTEETYKRLGTLLGRYFTETLQASLYEILGAGYPTRENNPMLSTIWSNKKSYNVPVFKGKVYSCQSAYAFHQKKPLWITAPTGGSLSTTREYIDSWSGATDLPPYYDPENIAAATSIIVPFGSPAIGYMDIEFKRPLKCTHHAKEELSRLAEALNIIISLYETHKLQESNTDKAINTLDDHLGRDRMSPLVKPKVFFAFSARADNEVVGWIKDVLDKEFADDLEVVSWDQMSQSGNINQQILEAILNVTYGICYFSEPKAPDSHDFSDNPNVVFEAGMLQALINLPTTKPTAWIPIREQHSPQAPFDFASERMVMIRRDQNNRVNTQALCHTLESRIKEWLNR